MSEFVEVSKDDLKDGTMKVVLAQGREILTSKEVKLERGYFENVDHFFW